MKDILLQYFQEAATDKSQRDSVQIVEGYWQLKIKGRDKWLNTCLVACVPSIAEQIEDGDTLIVRWLSYADMIFGADGLMAQALPNYEMRPGQLHMARLVQRSIEMSEPFVCEAGTGIGKSFAYAAICMAMGKHCIIATSNKALQMQLYNKDIPFLQTLFHGKRLVLAQGKSNYVCLENCRKGVEDRRFAEWIQTTPTGSIEELTFDLDTSKYTVDEECTGKRCDFYANCFYFRQKALRQGADVIICNHSLLALNHRFPGANILPTVDVVIVDEAHQLPNYVRNAIGWEYHAGLVRKALGRIYDRDQIYVGTAEDLLLNFEHELVRYIGKYGDKQITIALDMTFPCGLELVGELRNVADAVWPIEGDVINKEERKKERRAHALRNLARDIASLCYETAEGHVRWIDVETPKITNVPFDVSGFIRSMVEHTFDLSDDRELEEDYAEDTLAIAGQPTYIFTSATLATPTLKGFKKECGIGHGFELVAQSPFDYERNALLYVPNGSTPPPNQPDFLQYLVDEVRGLVYAAQGGVFLLFTSWSNMKHCLDALRHELKNHFPVYVQGELPKLEIVRRFKADGNAVLFATKSFWEGVDIPGDALRCVIIDKMPFAAPSPLFKAREATSNNSFADIALPEMIIDLKQGVGRLVRRSTDKGVIAILDSRIRSKPYGRNIVLKSLPPSKLTHSTAMITEFFADNRKVDFPDLTTITVTHTIAPADDFTLVF